LNGNAIANNSTQNVTFTPAFTAGSPYSGNVTFRFKNLPREGVYVARITVIGTGGSEMAGTVLVTILPDGSTPFDSTAGVTLDVAGTYASDVVQWPLAVAGPFIDWPFNTTGPVSISVGTWAAPPQPGPAANGTYFGIYADNQSRIEFPIRILVPLPPGFNATRDTATLLTWNSTSNSWVESEIPVDPQGPTYTTAIITIGHLSMYALMVYDPLSFLIYDLATLIETINATSRLSWSKLCYKGVMLEKISMICALLDDGNYASAYDMLLHDIKPKLTGLKTDENGKPWGNGVFRHPWIVDPALRAMLGSAIDAALVDIKACQEKSIHDALDSLGSHLAAQGRPAVPPPAKTAAIEGCVASM